MFLSVLFWSISVFSFSFNFKVQCIISITWIIAYISSLVLSTLSYVFLVDGGWDDWTKWATCSVTCGGGSQNRSRTCTNPVPQYGGADCVGFAGDIQDCNTHNCPSTLIHSIACFWEFGSVIFIAVFQHLDSLSASIRNKQWTVRIIRKFG